MGGFQDWCDWGIYVSPVVIARGKVRSIQFINVGLFTINLQRALKGDKQE